MLDAAVVEAVFFKIMRKPLKTILIGVGALFGVLVVGAGGFVFAQTRAFDASVQKKYDVLLPIVVRSTDPKVLARGKHLTESVGACSTADCHGSDLAGGTTIVMGPLGNVTGPNITPGGAHAQYSDGEIARVIRHGIERDGTTIVLMPSQEFGWLSLEDVSAIISYLRTVPAVQKPDGPVEVKLLGKLMDRQDNVPFDVARRIDHAARVEEVAPVPEPTARYGEYLALSCRGCHGATLGGGPIPGAPPSMAIPKNVTPHATGLASWSYEDFVRMCSTGTSKDGRKLDPMMPYEALSKLNETEKRALWAFLQTVPPVAFGKR